MHQISPVAEIVSSIVTLLLMGAAILAVTKRYKVPFTVVLVLAGISLAWLANAYPHRLASFRALAISPDLILYVFLPTLVFESAFNMDARQLRRNVGAVLMLAAPGLLLSTAVIGLIVGLATPIPLPAALLLGAILSATDPVAVIGLFKQIGAPQRLAILVEGESLFNDATSLVVARILIGVVVAGSVSAGMVAQGVLDFFVLFVGGLVVGWVLGLLTGLILGKVESDPFIEITLTTVLAYLSFLLGEKVLHVSGIMATIGAGLTLGGWGRMKISPSVRTYLEHFWEYMAFIANTLIFLMVGLRVEISSLWGALNVLLWVILATLVSRAVVVYGLMPLVGRVRGGEPVNLPYQTVIFWGGLRGAIALAIALSLPSFEQAGTFVVLVMGVVLFTLLVQGLTIQSLMRGLGLDRPPLPDRLARVGVSLTAKQQALGRIGQLMAGGLFSGPIAERLQQQCETEIARTQAMIQDLRQTELSHDQERRLLYLRGFAEEKSAFTDMFNQGHLSEGAFRELMLILGRQIDHVRYQGVFQPVRVEGLRRRRLEQGLYRVLELLPGLASLAERLRLARVATNYEEAWGHYQSSSRVLECLDELAQLESIPADIVEEVRRQYQHWQETARRYLDQIAEQFPEFVNTMQERVGRRLILFTEAEATREHAERGILPRGVEESIQTDIARALRALRGYEVAALRIKPTELLRRVPFFHDIPPQEFAGLATRLRAHTVAEQEVIIRQGEPGDSVFLIARGVVRVSYQEDGVSRDLATLLAGDFFGEMALLHREPRTATVRAVTPCSLYELRRADLDSVMGAYPAIRHALEEADRKRRVERDRASNPGTVH